ncbi:MAG: hypothetical protein WCP21_09200 [Armatimonadota bacterium]
MRKRVIILVGAGLFIVLLELVSGRGHIGRGQIPFAAWLIALMASAGLPLSRRWRRVTGAALRDPLIVLLVVLAQLTLSGEFGAAAAANPTNLWLWPVVLVLAVLVRIGQGLLEDSPISIFWKDPLEDSLDD